MSFSRALLAFSLVTPAIAQSVQVQAVAESGFAASATALASFQEQSLPNGTVITANRTVAAAASAPGDVFATASHAISGLQTTTEQAGMRLITYAEARSTFPPGGAIAETEPLDCRFTFQLSPDVRGQLRVEWQPAVMGAGLSGRIDVFGDGNVELDLFQTPAQTLFIDIPNGMTQFDVLTRTRARAVLHARAIGSITLRLVPKLSSTLDPDTNSCISPILSVTPTLFGSVRTFVSLTDSPVFLVFGTQRAASPISLANPSCPIVPDLDVVVGLPPPSPFFEIEVPLPADLTELYVQAVALSLTPPSIQASRLYEVR